MADKKIIKATPQEIDEGKKAMYKEMDTNPDTPYTQETAREAKERIKSAGRSALDEQRRETRGQAPELTKRRMKVYKGGGSVSSASKRADGCAMRGKTKGRMV
jgi:hypothetical protein